MNATKRKAVRATKRQNEIIQAHFEARRTMNFKCRTITSVEDLIEALKAGETCEALFAEIEIRYATIGSILISQTFDHWSESYKRSIRKGFITFLNKYNIV